MPEEIVEHVYTTRGDATLRRMIRESIDAMWLKGFVLVRDEIEDDEPGRVATLDFITDYDEDEADE
jgi:hypothetical protein